MILLFNSDKMKEQRNLKDNFENCMKDVAKNYCINNSLEYLSIFLENRYVEGFPSKLFYPRTFRCEDKRIYNEMSIFKFTKEEISNCVNEYLEEEEKLE